MIPLLASSEDAVDGESTGGGGDRGRVPSFGRLPLELPVALAAGIGRVLDGFLIGDGRSIAWLVVVRGEHLALAR